ncbi:molybdate ABC transporter substrate-binding protein [Intrasporangium sp. DVR]|uniref:molybdate ABC transporter substrate-binding protein n=1 Tax=Intrasporangium sp. DVR TaxID=3127867 RepID=UPI00313A64BA
MRRASPAAYGVVLLALAACTGAPAPDHTVTVLAAASLTEAFGQVSADFEREHPGVTVEVSYGSSATLVQQVNQGAPAELIALAGEAAAEPLDRSRVTESRIFTANLLEIAVPPSNPGRVRELRDLGRAGLKVVLCAEAVPCGRAADATFARAGVSPSVVSREVDVKATLSKVRLGEADAAVVYHSDVVAARGAVTGVPIPQQLNTRLRYPVLLLGDDPSARAFVDFLVGDRGQQTLRSLGFASP